MAGFKETQATRATLLSRVRNPADSASWREFDGRYRGLIVRYLMSRGLQIADAEDAAQVVMGKLVSGLRAFEYDREKGGFRAYLFRCAKSSLADHNRRQARRARAVFDDEGGVRGEQQGSADDGFAAFEKEWVDHHYRLALGRYRERADARGVRLLEDTLAGKPVGLMCEELGMSEGAVHKAQQRLRDALRELVAEQIRDEDSEHGG